MHALKVFISYSHDSPEHENRILGLSDQLREQGIDCIIDQYEQSPEEGWPLWCEKQVQAASYVLVACTETYLRRLRKQEESWRGLGATWEGHIITQELYNTQGKNDKFIPIIFCPNDVQFIPLSLQGFTHYQLEDGYDALYRRLTAQSLIIKPTLGSLKGMAPNPPFTSQPRLNRRQNFDSLWNVRFRRNSFFTGRERVLTDLRTALRKSRSAALSGLGGVGKTHTAVEYAYRHRRLYTAVFWAEAESRETLLASFVSIAVMLKLPSAQAKEQELAAQDVKRWLESNPRWLLILDNADDLSLVQTFLPSQLNGYVLLTTRVYATTALAQRVSLREMTPEEGALLLLRRAALIRRDAPITEATDADRDSAIQLSIEMGGLPLAIDQAGAFIEEMRRSLSEYAELYATEKANLLAERGSLGDHSSVTVTFSLAFERVAANNAAAADLVRLCAFLGADAIPEEIFTEGAPVLGDKLGRAAVNKLAFARTIGEAGRFSLLDRDATNQTLGMHRLVQLVIKDAMPNVDRRIWAERAVRATREAFHSVEYADWTLCQKLITHAYACADLIDEWNFDFVEAATLLNQAACYLSDRGLFSAVEPLYLRSLAIRERALGPDHPQVAMSLNNIAMFYADQGKYSEAESLYQRSLAIWEKLRAPDHPDMALSLNNLAVLYRQQGRYAEAEPLYQRSLAIYQNAMGPEVIEVAMSLNNLATFYLDQARYAEAEPLFKRSLAIWERALGPNHPTAATGLDNLAELYRNEGRYAEAEPLYQRSIAINEKALGPDHPDLARSLHNLALLYDAQGEYVEAEQLCRRARAIWEKALKSDHPDIAKSLNSLAELCRERGNYDEAEPLFQRSLTIRETVLGADHPEVATALNNLALLYHDRAMYNEAEPLYLRSLAIREAALGANHPDVASSLNNLAELYRKQGRYADAEPLYQRSLTIRDKVLSADHPDIAMTFNNMALFYNDQGKYTLAEALFQRSLAMLERTLGLDDRKTILVRSNLDALRGELR